MARPTESLSIEFIDLTPAGQAGAEAPRPENSNRSTPFVAIFVVLSAFVLIGMSVANRSKTTSPPGEPVTASSTTPTTVSPAGTQPPPASGAGTAQLESYGLGPIPWRQLPRDHEPIITVVPGSGEPVFGTPTEESLVYVSSLGRPTVIDLDTGRISSVILAPTSRGESFGVEFGAAVPLSESTKSTGSGYGKIATATPRTVAFFTIPEGPATVSELESAAAAPGPFLCLSEKMCEVRGWKGNEVKRGIDEYRYLTLERDSEFHEALFGDSWATDGLYRHAPDGRYDGFRLPTPLNDDAWVLYQPILESDAR